MDIYITRMSDGLVHFKVPTYLVKNPVTKNLFLLQYFNSSCRKRLQSQSNLQFSAALKQTLIIWLIPVLFGHRSTMFGIPQLKTYPNQWWPSLMTIWALSLVYAWDHWSTCGLTVYFLAHKPTASMIWMLPTSYKNGFIISRDWCNTTVTPVR